MTTRPAAGCPCTGLTPATPARSSASTGLPERPGLCRRGRVARPRSSRCPRSTIWPRTTRASGNSCSTASRSPCRTGLSGISPTSASRWSRCSPTSATTSATTRTPSAPRPTSTRPASASPCDAMRGSSTTTCTRGATPARGSAYRQRPTSTRCPPSDIYFITGYPDIPASSGRVVKATDLETVPQNLYEVFEPVVTTAGQTLEFRAAHSQIQLYTWGDEECCLPAGATRATLLDETPGKGMVGAPARGAPASSAPGGAGRIHRPGSTAASRGCCGLKRATS